jgi:hypothetical protein
MQPRRKVHVEEAGTYRLRGRGLVVGDGLGAGGGAPPERFGGIAVTAWCITDGQIQGVAVSGRTVVSISDRCHVPPRRLLLVDEDADPEQLRWLLDAFQGRLGGPLGEMAPQGLGDLGFWQLPLVCSVEGGRQTISIPSRISAVLTSLPAGEADTQPMRPWFSSGHASWTPRWRSRVIEGSVRWPEHGLSLDLEGCSALSGPFDLWAQGK